ncbi:MAG: peptide chain release factor 2 [Gammaproteobacteria bacterium]
MAKERLNALRGYLDLEKKEARLSEILRILEDPQIWKDQEKAQSLGRERSLLQNSLDIFSELSKNFADTKEMLELIASENDEASFLAIQKDVDDLEKKVADLEFQRMFNGEMDANNAYMDIQSGSGGTEAQDWAEMLLRMYLRFGDRHGFQTEILECSAGDVAGIKSATVKLTGSYAYGWLRTETGVHRLVRKSPFDANNKRHTSFASVFIAPEIDDDIVIEINPADLRVDTYRAQGAGGQHVNTTDSAVRITHIPTNTVVQCQSERSQHQNRLHAMKQLRAKLYELEMRKKQEKLDALEASKKEITWGSQIRSYVLDDSRIKDLRTGVETRNPQPVLDGDLDMFIEASLKE